MSGEFSPIYDEGRRCNVIYDENIFPYMMENSTQKEFPLTLFPYMNISPQKGKIPLKFSRYMMESSRCCEIINSFVYDENI
jgi:hypothetical protein